MQRWNGWGDENIHLDLPARGSSDFARSDRRRKGPAGLCPGKIY